jgi:hypothetical protein
MVPERSTTPGHQEHSGHPRSSELAHKRSAAQRRSKSEQANPEDAPGSQIDHDPPPAEPSKKVERAAGALGALCVAVAGFVQAQSWPAALVTAAFAVGIAVLVVHLGAVLIVPRMRGPRRRAPLLRGGTMWASAGRRFALWLLGAVGAAAIGVGVSAGADTLLKSPHGSHPPTQPQRSLEPKKRIRSVYVTSRGRVFKTPTMPSRKFLGAGTQLMYTGICLAKPLTRPGRAGITDERWLLRRGGGLVPAAHVKAASLPDLQPNPACPGAGSSEGPSRFELLAPSLSEEPDQRKRVDLNTHAALVGFAVLAARGRGWQSLGLARTRGTQVSMRHIVATDGVILAVSCWAEGIPAHPRELGSFPDRFIWPSRRAQGIEERAGGSIKNGALKACSLPTRPSTSAKVSTSGQELKSQAGVEQPTDPTHGAALSGTLQSRVPETTAKKKRRRPSAPEEDEVVGNGGGS